MPPKFIISLLLSAAIAIMPAASAHCAEPGNYQNEIAELAELSDAVLIGSIEKQVVDVSRTVADIRVESAYKGSVRAGDVIKLAVNSGRVMISKDEPDLTGVNKAVFFISKKSGSDTQYGCVQGSYGFKPLINDSIYTNPQNPADRVKLKKYLAALGRLKTAQTNPT